ncbi:hypothetical protein BCR36DRAFT_394751 [Piromyces finnis]|uniref:HECT-type E3 ubiquitin transferase n=1 Tax=Piromyces finnis TaxID=1754191 RepID=A0A1Y1VLD5_9FUNG|nr:hypothetical protein BCR36DRAFT_394751 [Piromyces finnis]|eukprot:ORX59289.1 hypothetical protein BCR36DRAFT_394751 [Piromyces finnis]
MYNEKSGITSEYKLSFKRKVSSIRSRLIPLLTVTDLLDPIDIKISRNNIYLDAYSNISRLSPNELKKKIQIEYNNEIGIDDSGLLKDFFYQLSKVVRKPDFGLFVPIQEDSYMLKINPDSKKKFQNNYLNHFKFIGRLIGLAIYHGHYLSIPFNILFYKELLNKNITIDDIKHIDASLYESLKSLKTCRNIDALDLTFEIDIKDSSGKNKTIELMKNGKSTKVNNNNINEYIDLLIKKKFLSSEEPLKKIKEGLYEIVPKTILFLINGINEIDINDWKNNTSYRGGYNNNSPTIKYFWQCVSEFNNKNRIKLLTFVTGNSQIPVTGFSDMINCCGVKGFHICKIDREDGLPVSHTW